MADSTHDGPHGGGCTCDVDPLSGPQVRLDVHTPDPETAARIIEGLSRQAVGYATEGMVASLIVTPHALEVDVDLDVELGP